MRVSYMTRVTVNRRLKIFSALAARVGAAARGIRSPHQLQAQFWRMRLSYMTRVTVNSRLKIFSALAAHVGATAPGTRSPHQLQAQFWRMRLSYMTRVTVNRRLKIFSAPLRLMSARPRRAPAARISYRHSFGECAFLI